MKPGITVIKKQQVGDRTLWLTQDSPKGRGGGEWATYVSSEVDGKDTKHGRYFVNYDNAILNFYERVKQYEESQTVRFVDWEFRSCTTEDEEDWWWAEFYFEDEQGKLIGKSPIYTKGASDFYCLLEDTLKAAQHLREGAYWQEVCNSFRQAW